MKSLTVFFTALLLSCATVPPPHPAGNPYELPVSPLVFTPPPLKNHEFKLANGVTVFVVEDPKLPVFDLRASFRVGELNEPKELPGVAGMTAELLRTGGTDRFPSDSFDALVDFYAASLSSDLEMTQASASLSVLTDKIDTGLILFTEMLRHPLFEQKKLDLLKSQTIDQIKQRFDQPANTSVILYNYALYGKGKISELLTEPGVKKISRDDVVKFYKAYYRPENLTLAVSGRFETKTILEKLNQTLGTWTAEGKPNAIPPVTMTTAAGFLFVEKDINQANVRVGLPLIQRPHPDYFPLVLANWVVGGAAFTSRVSKRVREDEGLAYDARTQMQCGYFYPGTFAIRLQTKSSTTAYALQLAFEEIAKFVKEGPSAQELAEAKKSMVDAFPSLFESGNEIAGAFLDNRYVGREDNYYETYRDQISAVTIEDVKRVSAQYLKRENFTLCLVGKFADCEKGDGSHPAKLSDYGTPKRLTEKELEALCAAP